MAYFVALVQPDDQSRSWISSPTLPSRLRRCTWNRPSEALSRNRKVSGPIANGDTVVQPVAQAYCLTVFSIWPSAESW